MEVEVLKQNLDGKDINLTDDQLKLIADIATDNETAVVETVQRNSVGLIEKLTGVKIGENMRQEDYFKTAIDTHTTKLVSEKDGLINKLNEQIGANKDELSQKYSALLEKEKSFTETLAETEARLKQEAIDAKKELTNFKTDFQLKSHIPNNFKVEDKVYNEYLKNQALTKVKEGYEIIEKDGEVMLKKDFKEYSPADVFKSILKDSLKEDKSGGGAGDDGKGGKIISLNNVTGSTKVEFATNLEKALLQNGLVKGSKEYSEAYIKATDADFYKQLKLN